MATLSLVFISSKVFVILSVAICIMLATGAPLVHVRSADCGTCESGGWIYDELTNIVSHTLLLRNISELSAYSALLVQNRNSIIGACLKLYRTFLTVILLL